MKEFVPISDEMLEDLNTIEGTLVPFNLEYLRSKKRVSDTSGRSVAQGMMPTNWISDNDYASACKRLAECQS